MSDEKFRVEIVVDKPTSGMWHCGPNPSWVTVTHLPTMTQARAYGRSQHKARAAAMACVQMMLDDSLSADDVCSFPEALGDPDAQVALDRYVLSDPRVKALVEALRQVDAEANAEDKTNSERLMRVHQCVRAALRAIGGE